MHVNEWDAIAPLRALVETRAAVTDIGLLADGRSDLARLVL